MNYVEKDVIVEKNEMKEIENSIKYELKISLFNYFLIKKMFFFSEEDFVVDHYPIYRKMVKMMK
jgi:hypothetical protein